MRLCADIIARYDDAFIVIERLSDPKGLSFPGGGCDPGEDPKDTAVREFFEETGLTLYVEGYLGRFDKPGRDPRGEAVSETFYGTATGTPKGESGKTLVLHMTKDEIFAAQEKFVFDHFEMFEQYVYRTITT